jgi:hypothetical protein
LRPGRNGYPPTQTVTLMSSRPPEDSCVPPPDVLTVVHLLLRPR